MKHMAFFMVMAIGSFPLMAADDVELQLELKRLKQQTEQLEGQVKKLEKKLAAEAQTPKKTVKFSKLPTKSVPPSVKMSSNNICTPVEPFHRSPVSVHLPNLHPESLEFYPTALVADEQVITYIAGTPIVTTPYLGSRPAFDGSDYIVNISSINRDIRLMQQRRRLYRAYRRLGYPAPDVPIMALSGKVEPVGSINLPSFEEAAGDWSLGSSELDVAVALNEQVEGYMALAYNSAPPLIGGQRVANSSLFLNMGFVNIGNLDTSPLYFTAGQLYAPFGRFSSSMVSSPLPAQMARTRTRPFILGYKSQQDIGPFAAIYAFRSDTTLGGSGVGGINLGYIFDHRGLTGEVGASFISALNDATGMQYTGSAPGTTFGGFASPTNGNEAVHKVPGVDVHGNVRFDRYNITAEWVSAVDSFRTQDLSFNGKGARPQAGQIEAGMTFMAFNKPASAAVSYQWSKNTLALNMPAHRINAVFNISIWRDTVESLEYRHDIDFNANQFANGASPAGMTNANTVGTGRSTDTILAQIGVYF